jgi:hypothetical protein
MTNTSGQIAARETAPCAASKAEAPPNAQDDYDGECDSRAERAAINHANLDDQVASGKRHRHLCTLLRSAQYAGRKAVSLRLRSVRF